MLDRVIEAEKSIRGETGPFQATMVMPPALAVGVGDADTQIINPAIRQQVAASAPDNVARLTRMADKRRARGWWLFILVLLLAAGAGGTGWYFGSGPGSMVVIPDVSGKAPEVAATALKDAGFETKQGSAYSTVIAKGLVASTIPAANTHANRGSTVTINVSQGPQPIQVPKLAGLTKDAAIEQITSLKAVVGTVDNQFNADVPSGTVISASTADGKDLSNGGHYFQGMKVNLVVSVGAIPDVKGASVNDATAKLQAAGLKTTPGPQSYSDTIPKDAVISAIAQKQGPVRPGDTLALEVSRGPAPVPVPDVVGQSWDVAKKALLAAGFKLNYNPIADLAPSNISVSKTTPGAGTEVAKGSSVTVNFAGF